MDNMTDNDGLICPKCHWPVEPDDRFCEECGQALQEQKTAPQNDCLQNIPAPVSFSPEADPAPAKSNLPPQPAALPEQIADHSPTPISPIRDIPIAKTVEENRADSVDHKIAQKMAPFEAPEKTAKNNARASASDSLHSQLPIAPLLEVDMGQELQCGLSVSLRARIKIPENKRLQVRIMVSGDDNTACSDTMGLDYDSGLLNCSSHFWTDIVARWAVPMDLTPGYYRANWKLVCDGNRFEGNSHHWIFPDPERSNPAFNQTYNIMVTNTNNIQGHANDAKTGGSPIHINNPNVSSGTVDRIYRNSQTPPKWQSLPLICTSCFGPPKNLPKPPPEAFQKHLTILLNGKRLHLLSGDEISIGRSSSQDIVARCFSKDYKLLANESRLISSAHAVLKKNRIEGGLRFTDKSTNGSRLNDTPCHQATMRINDDEIYHLAMGLSNQKPALSWHLQACSCNLPAIDPEFCTPKACSGHCAATILKRQDDIPESYAVAWCHVAMPSCEPGWPEVSIWRIGEAFAWRSVKGAGWLVPGTRLELPDGKNAFVQNFSQFGIEKSSSPKNT